MTSTSDPSRSVTTRRLPSSPPTAPDAIVPTTVGVPACRGLESMPCDAEDFVDTALHVFEGLPSVERGCLQKDSSAA